MPPDPPRNFLFFFHEQFQALIIFPHLSRLNSHSLSTLSGLYSHSLPSSVWAVLPLSSHICLGWTPTLFPHLSGLYSHSSHICLGCTPTLFPHLSGLYSHSLPTSVWAVPPLSSLICLGRTPTLDSSHICLDCIPHRVSSLYCTLFFSHLSGLYSQ